MTYEEYYAAMDYADEGRYDNGFCPMTRKPCMGSDCQIGNVVDEVFTRCGLVDMKVVLSMEKE